MAMKSEITLLIPTYKMLSDSTSGQVKSNQELLDKIIQPQGMGGKCALANHTKHLQVLKHYRNSYTL